MKKPVFRDSTIRSRILQLATLAALVLCLLEVALAWSVQRAQQANVAVEHTVDTLNALRAYSRGLVDSELAERNYLLTRQQVYLRPYRDYLAQKDSLIADMIRLNPDDPVDPQYRMLRTTVDQEVGGIGWIIQLSDEGQSALALAIMNASYNDGNMKVFRAMASHIFDAETGLLTFQEAKAHQESAKILYFVGLGTILVISLIIGSAKASADAIQRRYLSLLQGIQAISNDSLDARVLVTSDDEFGILAAEFNKMTDHLAASNQARDYAQALVASSRDAIGSTDLAGLVTTWNPAAEITFGYQRSEIIGQQGAVMVPESHLEEAARIRERLRAGESVEIETIRRRKNGELFHVSMTSSPIRNAAGEVIGISKISRDISDRKLAEATTEKLLSRLVASNAELSRFAYVASHDMQEPLRMIATFSQILARRHTASLNEEGLHHLDVIMNAALRMKEMVHDLLQYAAVPEESVVFRETEMETALRDATNCLSHLIEETSAIISHDPLPKVLCNGNQMTRLFQNLLSNAMKYRRPEVTPIIRVAVEERDGDWLFSVEDNGLGVNAEFQDEIFQPFRRLHTWNDIAGTGLGLPVCRRILENHGGKLWVSSAPGEGSVFYFTLIKAKEGVKKELLF